MWLKKDEVVVNRAASLHIAEVACYARRLVDAFNAGEYDDDEAMNALQGELAHLMGHLALAWHYAVRTDEEIDALSPEQFGRLMDAIPKMGVSQYMVEPWEKVIEIKR